MEYFIACDIFGIEYKFLRNGKVKHKNKTGLVLTIIYIIIVIFLFLGFGIDLYLRRNPKISFNTLIKPYEEKNISNNQFLFAFRIEDENSIEIIDETFLKLSLIYIEDIVINGEWQKNKTIRYINKTRCLDIPGIKEKEKFYNISLKNWYCIDFENKTLGGYSDGNFMKYFSIIVKHCENTTANNFNCQSHDRIIDNFKTNDSGKFLFSYLYMEAMLTLDDFNNPLKSTLINRFEVLDTKISKSNTQIFKEVAINNDIGWIFSNNQLESIYASNNIQPDFRMKHETEESLLFGYLMFFGKRYDVYNRSYIRVQEVIASIGGFSKFFYLIVSLIYEYISNILKNIDFIETSYTNYNQKLNTNILIEDNKIDISNRSKIDINLTKNIISITNKNKKKELDLNLILRYKIFCKKNSRLSKEQKISILEYEEINKYHNHKFDVITYLNVLKEFSYIKKILFDDIQQKAIEIINNEYKINEPVNFDLFFPKLIEYFSNNEMSEVNKRLITFFQYDDKK